ncbi:uncharacterized protein RHOBADRAFT_56235 [Rhodotorula graminis WP1]|uniref:Uncharacterized protein n=1 Tax=Rhodotorula graminis (strain WP1) TaxID=578459 RepID=A0A0P9GWP2_RHOGW|nr:uncharacterized protein RHOBADRAFT_56235 [Rhodotorula graminis WP1]KPV71843.1 hypothetical protein RHOBADRAFT_56235 [Rhodotorula graminis WP1]
MSTTASSTTPTVTGSSSSATPTTTYGYPYWGGSSGFSSTWVTWVSVVVVAGVVVALLCSRYFYIRRFYHRPTFRAYFVPDKGIHLKWLGIHIAGPPHRIPREPPPSYAATARRRRRRGRQTAGETVAEGGRRIGARDDDDGWDDLDMVERGGPGGGLVPAVPATLDELPRYYVDSGLPGYTGGEGDAADEAERIRAEAAAAGESSVIPSAAEYEAAIRASRDPAAAASTGAEAFSNDQHPPAYPPAAHLSAPTPADVPARPARPTLPGRTSTARSALLLSAFRRAPSPSPSPDVAAGASAPADGPPHALGAPSSSSSSSATFDSAPSSPRTRPADLERSASSESTSSASTKLGKSAAASSSSVKGKRSLALEDDDGDESADASSSRVKLDGGDKAHEGGKGGDA